MDLHRPATLAEFITATSPFLVRHEAEHGLMLSVAADAARAAHPPPNAYWAVVMEDGAPVAAALRTADKLLLSREEASGAAARLARDAMPRGTAAVLGPPASVDAFAREAADAFGVAWRPGIAPRIYELRRVVSPPPVAGTMRVAVAEDREMLVQWALAVALEAEGHPADERAMQATVARRLGEGAQYVWAVDGRVVATAAAVGPTPRGIRVTAVYTPPECRRRGYATALVGALSQHLLEVGHEFVFLYTDLANPTSNAIYQRLGYVPVADVRELWLEPG